MRIKIIVNVLILLLFSFSVSAQFTLPGNSVTVIAAPIGSLVPDVFLDNAGVLHMVYAKNQNAYYVKSIDNGITFSNPVLINTSGSVEYNMGERGPKLSVGNDGVIHVAWMDHWNSGVSVYARYSRSTNGGLSFEPLKSVSGTPGVDGVTLAADGNDQVLVFWHTMVPQQTAVPSATWLHYARSADNGITFSADTNVLFSNHSGLACSMCMTRARFDADGSVCLAFRSAENSIRDFYLLKGNPLVNNFEAYRINIDNWNINYCPMAGASLEISNSGKLYSAFMTGNHVYWAVSDTGIPLFTQHNATPLNEFEEIYPTAVANNSGLVLFVWQIGPMSVNDSAIVKWALYNSEGSFTGQQGVAGKTFSGTKATAFVGTDDNFYIVANTQNLTSVQDPVESAGLQIMPNPASDQIFIPFISNATELELFDCFGKLVLKKTVNSSTILTVSNLSQGIYILAVRTPLLVFKRKIIVDR